MVFETFCYFYVLLLFASFLFWKIIVHSKSFYDVFLLHSIAFFPSLAQLHEKFDYKAFEITVKINMWIKDNFTFIMTENLIKKRREKSLAKACKKAKRHSP